MDKENLTSFIRNTFFISPERLEEITSHFKEIYIPRNDFFLRSGNVSNQYLFLDTGFMRGFTMDTEGNEVTTAFFGNRQVVFEVASFFLRIPSQENIQALTASQGWYIDFDKVQHLFHSIPEFREFGRTVLVKGYASFKQRTLSMINLTAEKRYEQLMQTNPEVFQNAPLKHIASYLGITDTSLSRIRKELSQR